MLFCAMRWAAAITACRDSRRGAAHRDSRSPNERTQTGQRVATGPNIAILPIDYDNKNKAHINHVFSARRVTFGAGGATGCCTTASTCSECGKKIRLKSKTKQARGGVIERESGS